MSKEDLILIFEILHIILFVIYLIYYIFIVNRKRIYNFLVEKDENIEYVDDVDYNNV